MYSSLLMAELGMNQRSLNSSTDFVLADNKGKVICLIRCVLNFITFWSTLASVFSSRTGYGEVLESSVFSIPCIIPVTDSRVDLIGGQ